MRSKFGDVIKRHKPQGYKLRLRPMTANSGLTQFERSITVDSNLEDRAALFVFLHECGHVHHRHLIAGRTYDLVHDEYEADQYAIKAMKAEGIPIPRVQLADHKEVMREYIKEAHGRGETVEEHILKYAYGRTWRKYR